MSDDNIDEHLYVDDDGKVLRGIEKISCIPVKDFDGKPIGEVKTFSCATRKDVRLRVMEFLWGYDRKRNLAVESVRLHLRAMWPHHASEVEAFLASKRAEEPPR